MEESVPSSSSPKVNVEDPPAEESTLRARAKKLLDPSVIRRICKIEKNKIWNVSKNASAEVVYTNSQFGLKPIPCTGSKCTGCSLAPPQRRPGKSKRSSSVANIAKRRRTESNEIEESKEPLTNEDHTDCVEFRNFSCLMYGLREKNTNKPRLSTKRNLVKRPKFNRKRRLNKKARK